MRIGPKALGAAVAALLIGASVFLAFGRIYQVDEIQNVFMARIVGMKSFADCETGVGIFLFGPMAALARRTVRSASLLAECRALFLLVFWVNVLLLALLSGARLRTSQGLAILLGAATLAPLWDYGMEIRHDNLLLLGLLFIWTLGRLWVVRSGGLRAYVAIGFLGCLMELTAFKGFLYAIPACAILLAFPHPSVTTRRRVLAVALTGGALVGLAAGRAIHAFEGTWPIFVESIRGGVRVSAQLAAKTPNAANAQHAISPSHVYTLARLLVQTPLLVAGLAALLIFCVAEVRRQRREWFTGATFFPEVLLMLAAAGAFLVNPTPFPYILVLLVPQAFLATSRLVPALGKWLGRRAAVSLPLLLLLAVAQLVPFVIQTTRHLDHLNARQVLLADVAEKLTDPQKDAVWDGVGLVSTRKSIGFHWFLHSLNASHFVDGTWPPVRKLLTIKPASVILRSYRTDWLPPDDQDFIRRHYLALSDELLVLGEALNPPQTLWTCLHSGRYFLRASVNGAPAIILDGAALRHNPIWIEAGPHTLAMSSSVLIVWVGPTLQRPPSIGEGNHKSLYASWY